MGDMHSVSQLYGDCVIWVVKVSLRVVNVTLVALYMGSSHTLKERCRRRQQQCKFAEQSVVAMDLKM